MRRPSVASVARSGNGYNSAMSEPADPFTLIPHAAAIGMQLVSRAPHRCVVRVPYAEHLVGDPDTGVIHGGVITAVLDNASGMAVRGHDDFVTQGGMATLDLRIDYMRPAEPHHDLFTEAECYRTTPNVAFVRAVAYQRDRSDPVATSVATFMLGTLPGAAAKERSEGASS
jgi:uncharacterized protein (TIGR00369 family)